MPLDFKVEDDTVYWKLRGADTWTPFKNLITISKDISSNLYASTLKEITELDYSVSDYTHHDYCCGKVVNLSNSTTGVFATVISEGNDVYLLSSIYIVLSTTAWINHTYDSASASSNIEVKSYNSEFSESKSMLLSKSISGTDSFNTTINLFGSNFPKTADSIYFSSSIAAYATEGHSKYSQASAAASAKIVASYIKIN